MLLNAVREQDKIRSTSSYLELIPMYILVLEVHVYIKVTLKGELSSSPAISASSRVYKA